MTTRYVRHGAAAGHPTRGAPVRPGNAPGGRSGPVAPLSAHLLELAAAMAEQAARSAVERYSRNGATDRYSRNQAAEAGLARARAIGTAVGLRASERRRAVARAAGHPAFRASLEAYDVGLLLRLPATRTAADEAWVQAMIARREAYIRDRIAPLIGIDPDAAVEAARSLTMPALIARTGLGRLAI